MRLPADLDDVDGLIIPGGESTAMRKLIDRWGLRQPILDLAESGAPLFGTCAGMIVLAKRDRRRRGARSCRCSTSPSSATRSGASSTRSRPSSSCRCSATTRSTPCSSAPP